MSPGAGASRFPGNVPQGTANYPTATAGRTANSAGTATPNQALGLIQNLLTTPRPGGMPGAGGQAQVGLGAGIAGVATTVDAEGIMVYAERTNYKEWEFIYDPTKDKAAQLGQPGQQGQAGQPGQPGQPGRPGQPVPFGLHMGIWCCW
jgi:hypothetical protein